MGSVPILSARSTPSARATDARGRPAKPQAATVPRHHHRFEARAPVAPNMLERNFVAAVPNQKWLAELTNAPTAEGWLYLALILGPFSRRMVGWVMSDSTPQELTLEALSMALDVVRSKVANPPDPAFL